MGDVFRRDGRTDPAARLSRWHNHDRTHMSLGDGTETPARAFTGKIPRRAPRGPRRAGGGEYHVRTQGADSFWDATNLLLTGETFYDLQLSGSFAHRLRRSQYCPF